MPHEAPNSVPSNRTEFRRPRRSQAWQWIAMLSLAALAAVLGFVGHLRDLAPTGQPHPLGDLLYLTAQLFVLNGEGLAGAIPWQLQVARFLAPIVPAWAIVRAGTVLFHEQIQALRLRRSRGHVVVCGLGRKGLQLVKDFRSQGRRVVAVEIDEDNPALDLCRELGAFVSAGDGREPAILAKARADHADYVLAMTGDDGVNVDAALNCHRLAVARPQPKKITCCVHVVDLKLCNLLREHHVFTDASDPFDVRIFNTYEASARMLFSKRPLDRDKITADDPRAVHLVVIGFGQMGQSVLLQAAKTAHYANGRRLQATVVDRIADDKKKGFFSRYPLFDQVCDVSFFNADANDPKVLEHIEQVANDPDKLAAVALCLDSDSASLSYALMLAKKLGRIPVPLLVRMSSETGLAALLKESPAAAKDWPPMEVFGSTAHCCTRELLLSEDLDMLAKAIHETFRRQQLAKGRSADEESLQPWDRLMEDFKDSNRQQADHIQVKLRAIDCYSSPIGSQGELLEKFLPEEIELLARMEHRRWCAERYLAGWTFGEKDIARRRSPHLVEWEKLADDVKDYDRNAVCAIPAVLAKIEKAIYRSAFQKQKEYATIVLRGKP